MIGLGRWGLQQANEPRSKWLDSTSGAADRLHCGTVRLEAPPRPQWRGSGGGRGCTRRRIRAACATKPCLWLSLFSWSGPGCTRVLAYHVLLEGPVGSLPTSQRHHASRRSGPGCTRVLAYHVRVEGPVGFLPSSQRHHASRRWSLRHPWCDSFTSPVEVSSVSLLQPRAWLL